MRTVLKMVTLLVLAPFVLLLLLVTLISLPLLWEEAVKRVTTPPDQKRGKAA